MEKLMRAHRWKGQPSKYFGPHCSIAPRLTEAFTLICADLRGYGRSGCPGSDTDHCAYSKRAVANDMVLIMRQLRYERFGVAGHDRGARVAYRIAFDHAGVVQKVAVLDAMPTSTVWDRADARLALAFWPWSLLAQPEPLPERLLRAAPEAIVNNALNEWGSPPNAFEDTRASYIAALNDAKHIHAICEEYRAAATIDRAHHAEDQAAGERIACPVLILWSVRGGLEHWYLEASGPLTLWREWSDQVSGRAICGGHFFPEENPKETTNESLQFFLR
ncbi:alpha/beta hydrolase [Parapusillimonas sp. SGNA-6]|nr:alpha/beta hydrolase [Parapusillimonas sp. SGNA-6]